MARTSAKVKAPADKGQDHLHAKTLINSKSKALDDDLEDSFEDDESGVLPDDMMEFTGNSTVRRRLESFLEEKRLRDMLKDDFYEEW